MYKVLDYIIFFIISPFLLMFVMVAYPFLKEW